jgi:uncharacterized protein DUF3592
MQKTAQLSISQQVVLSLAVLLLILIGVTIAGYMAAGQDREKMAGFASDAAVATGTVTKKYVHVVGPGRTSVYWLDLTFTTADGASHVKSASVANTIYDRYKVGSPVQVTYVISRPEYFFIPGTEPTERDVGIADGMFRYGAIASVVCLVGLLGFLFGGRGGGAPTRQSPTSEQPSRATGYRGTNPPRAGFGTRRT